MMTFLTLIQSVFDMVKLESEARICVNCCLSYKSSKSNFIFSFKSKITLANKNSDHCSCHLPSLIVFYCDALIMYMIS